MRLTFNLHNLRLNSLKNFTTEHHVKYLYNCRDKYGDGLTEKCRQARRLHYAFTQRTSKDIETVEVGACSLFLFSWPRLLLMSTFSYNPSDFVVCCYYVRAHENMHLHSTVVCFIIFWH